MCYCICSAHICRFDVALTFKWETLSDSFTQLLILKCTKQAFLSRYHCKRSFLSAVNLYDVH